MELKNMPNLQAKLKNIKGTTGSGTLPLAIGVLVIALFMTLGILGMVLGRQPVGAAVYVVCMLVWALFLLLYMPYLKLKKDAENTWNQFTDEELASIEAQAKDAPEAGSSFLTKEALVIKGEGGAEAVPVKDIIWIYGTTAARKVCKYFETGKDFVIQVMDRHGKAHTMTAVRAEGNTKDNPLNEKIRPLLLEIAKSRPGVLVGYSDDRKEMAEKELDKMVRLSDRTMDEMSGTVQLPASYGWELSTEEGTIENPSMDRIQDTLNKLRDEEVQLMMLTPPEPINNMLYLRLAHEPDEPIFHVKAGIQNGEEQEVYAKDDLTYAQTMNLMQNYINRTAVSLEEWTKE